MCIADFDISYSKGVLPDLNNEILVVLCIQQVLILFFLIMTLTAFLASTFTKDIQPSQKYFQKN